VVCAGDGVVWCAVLWGIGKRKRSPDARGSQSSLSVLINLIYYRI
jgi:hypothetical protein